MRLSVAKDISATQWRRVFASSFPVADLGFPRRERVPTLRWGRQPIICPNFAKKCVNNKNGFNVFFHDEKAVADPGFPRRGR